MSQLLHILGAKALSAWLHRCRASVGVLKGESFTKLLGVLVKSVLLYGDKIQVCGRHALHVEQVELQTVRTFLRVGRLHPPIPLQFETKLMPLIWEAKRRCIKFQCRRMIGPPNI